MSGIVLFGGTVEGRKLAERLAGTSVLVHVCVATSYGASLLPQADNLQVYAGRMGETEMLHFLQERKPDYCLDATHPYAVEVTEHIRAACDILQLPYLRVLRDISTDAENPQPDTVFVDSVAAAVDFLQETTGTVFITTGSKELECYTRLPDYRQRCVARVLPLRDVMEKCSSLGFEGKNLIGMQGPFDEEMNYLQFRMTQARYVVTKASGRAGGYPEKCEAALRQGAVLVVVGRPGAEEGLSLSECWTRLEKKFGLSGEESKKPQLWLVGMGPGNPDLLTREAQQALEQAQLLIGARRVLEIWPDYKKKPHLFCYQTEEILTYLEQHPRYTGVALCYSGDIGFYSGARGMQERLERWQVHPVSGVSSVAYFLNRLGLPWNEVRLVSCHGQETDVVAMLRESPRICTLLGGKTTIAEIGTALVKQGKDKVKMTVGERLSYPEERIVTGYAADFTQGEWDALSLLLLEEEVCC